ncbi:MAG: hypothetical protein AB7S38_30665 [Vulcanimicrobiota bacterium]
MSIASLLPSTVAAYEQAILSPGFTLNELQVLKGLVSPGGHHEAHLLVEEGDRWAVKASAGARRPGRRFRASLEPGFGPLAGDGLAKALGMDRPALACRFARGAVLVSHPANERLVERAAAYLGRHEAATRESRWRTWVKSQLERTAGRRRQMRDSLHRVPCQELTVARLEFELMCMAGGPDKLESTEMVSGAMTRAAIHLRELLSGPLAEPSVTHFECDGQLIDLLEELEYQLGSLTTSGRGRIELPAHLEAPTELLLELLEEAGCRREGPYLSLPVVEDTL